MNKENIKPIIIIILFIIAVVYSVFTMFNIAITISKLAEEESRINKENRALSKEECIDNNGIYFKAYLGADSCVFKP